MAVNRFLRELDGLFNYSTDENPTTQQEYQEAVKNWVDTIKSLVDAVLWQPETEYVAGSQLLTPSLPYHVLRCTTGGTSGSVEPDYTGVAFGDTVTDGTVTWVVDGYLPLSGGTLRGVISRNGVLGQGVSNDGYLTLHGGVGTNLGSSLVLKGKDNDSGEFKLSASNGTNTYDLIGYSNGTLNWNGRSIVITSGTNYIRFGNGTQICWGEATIASAGATVTLPAPFANTDYRIVEGRWWMNDANETYYFADRTTTSFKRYALRASATNSRVSMYIAIGYWN